VLRASASPFYQLLTSAETPMTAERTILKDAASPRLHMLHQLERKLLWLSAWMVHHANHIRPNRDGLKVGGHQASCASAVSIMAALYFEILRPQDRVAVKPHAGPVFHAINYLFGRQSREKLATLREFGGIQPYPSRVKDGAEVDFSTGSVGLGVALTTFGSLVQDYVRLHGLGRPEIPPGRHVAIVGDAEPADLAQQLATAFTELRPSPSVLIEPPPMIATSIEIVDVRTKQQSAVAMLFRGPARGDRQRFATALMTGVASGLGGRFFESLRSRQSLAYSVFVSASTLGRAGMISAYIACAPERELEAREGLLHEFAMLRNEPVTVEELERARTYAIGMHALRQESAGAQLGDMVDAWMSGDGLAELTDEVRQLRTVTAADVQQVVQQWIDPDRRVEAIVRGVAKD